MSSFSGENSILGVRKFEHNDDERANSSNPQNPLTDCNMKGLVFIAQVNQKNRCFIPSTKNYFGGIHVRKVLVDTGCSSLNLPLEVDQIHAIFQNFDRSNFIFSIGHGRGIGGQALT
jgi:hypothetical protein